MPDEPTDDALLAAAARGEERAFVRLVERHAGRARALALRLTRNAADADDLVQEAFARAYAGAKRWRSEGVRFSTWLHRVLVNMAADEARRRTVRRTGPIAEGQEFADERPSAAAELERRERAAALSKAIDALPHRQREVVVLTYGQGLSNAEAAEVLQTTTEAVEAALTRARSALKAGMRAAGWIEE
jgi:RNA polymerase sigma-70 factor (ECF subfamily)